MTLLSTILLTLLSTTMEEPIETEKPNWTFTAQLERFLTRAYIERPYETIFLHRMEPAICVDENIQMHFMAPSVIFGSNATIYLKGNFNSELLAIVCVNTLEDNDSMEKLATNLQHMRDTRIVVIVSTDLEQSNHERLSNLFETCLKLKLLNVNVLHRDFFRTHLYHSYTQFPVFELETHTLSTEGFIFPNRLSNMQGKVLLTLPDLIEPRTMLFTDSSGRQQMTGYIGKFLLTFAEHYNCSLQFPFNMSNDQVFFLTEIREAAFNSSIDIPGSISELTIGFLPYEATYPIEIVKWLNMIPVEETVPVYRLLISVFSLEFLLIILLQSSLISVVLLFQMEKANCSPASFLMNVFCNDATIRGILGQPFEMEQSPRTRVKCTYFFLFLAGLFISTTYAANLSELLTAPPKQSPVASFDDAMKNNLPIMISADQIPGIILNAGAFFWKKYESAFTVVKSFAEFLNYRRNFDPRFGYSITTSIWAIYEEQQKYFTQKLFRISPELCYGEHLINSFPIYENSFYKEPMNRLIMRVHDSGLFNYWSSMSFYDMVSLGKMSFEDLSSSRSKQPLKVKDFFWIWVLYGTSVCICLIEFIIEKFIFYKFFK